MEDMSVKVEYGEPKKKTTRRWVQIWIPHEFSEDLKPVAEQNGMTLSDVVTLLAVEGNISLQARSDIHEARQSTSVETITCPMCGVTSKIVREAKIEDKIDGDKLLAEAKASGG